MQKVSSFFTFDQDTRNITNDTDEGCLPALSFKDRLMAFSICIGLAILIDIISLGSMFGMLTGNPTRYALSFTIGNILSIAATGFLLGFRRQMKCAFDEKRRTATIVFLTSMIMTLVSVFAIKIAFVTLIFILTQICAYI